MAVSIQKDIIPNEMRALTDYSWKQIADASGNYDSSNNQYKLTIHDLSDNSGIPYIVFTFPTILQETVK